MLPRIMSPTAPHYMYALHVFPASHTKPGMLQVIRLLCTALQLKLAQAGVHLFVEKPLSIQSAEEVAKLADELKQVQDQQKLIIAVGYMFR